MSKAAFLWNGCLLALLWGRTAWLVAIVPSSVPTHFDFVGHPDSWGSPATFFLFPGVATALTALLLAIGAALPQMARSGGEWINVPRKAKFLELPADARVKVVRLLSAMLACLPTGFIVTFAWILEGSARIAISGRQSGDTLPWFPMLLPIVAILGVVAWYSVRAAKLIDAEHAAHVAGT